MASDLTIDGAQDALWMATGVEPIETAPLQERVSCDVAVIGGGITGMSAALHLASAGVNVAVVEAKTIGYGASGRSGGQVNLGLNDGPDALKARFGAEKADRLIDLVINTPDEVFTLIRDHQLNCDPVQNGAVFGAKNFRWLAQMEDLVAQYQAVGADFSVLGSDIFFEQTGAHGFVGGMRIGAAGTLHPLSFTRELARTAQANGAKIYTDTEIIELGRAHGGWLIKSGFGQINADKVILCTNAYSGPLHADLAKTVVPVRSIQAATSPLPDAARREILPRQEAFIDKRRLILYCRYDRDGRLCVGDRGPTRDMFKEADFARLKSKAIEIFPQLRNVGWDFHWGGRVAITRDHLPFLTVIDDGLITGMGYNGRGVGMGTVMGRILAEMAVRGTGYVPPFPVTEPQRYPLHGLHPIGVWARNIWGQAMDTWE